MFGAPTSTAFNRAQKKLNDKMPTEPKLQKPGSGLPFFEHLYARYWALPTSSRKISWEQSVEQIVRESNRILEMTAGLTTEQLAKKILIKRIPGIEDSSRYWSAAMTMEHLIIVGTGMTDIIFALSNGTRPPVEPDAAKVKPHGTLPVAQARQALKDFTTRASEKLLTSGPTAIGDRNSPTTLKHPWFGELPARKWVWVLGFHQTVHRRQVAAITSILTSCD
jgi:hypothetical protein